MGFWLWLWCRVLKYFANYCFKMPHVSVKDVDQQVYVRAFAKYLLKIGKVKSPDWVSLVKTGKYKELPPSDPNWFLTRVASVARHIYLRSPVGVGALTKIYGGRERRGVAPSHFCRGSGSIARKALQALESLKFVEKDADGGRILTSQGQRHLDRIAAQIKLRKKAGKKPGDAKRGNVVLKKAVKKPAAGKLSKTKAATKSKK